MRIIEASKMAAFRTDELTVAHRQTIRTTLRNAPIEAASVAVKTPI
jgi:hypothetical protein